MATAAKLDDTSYEFSWDELATLLFKAKGITEGLWRLGVGLQFAAANVGPTDAEILPAGIIGIRSIVLIPVQESGPLVYDAARVGKKPAARKAARKKATTH